MDEDVLVAARPVQAPVVVALDERVGRGVVAGEFERGHTRSVAVVNHKSSGFGSDDRRGDHRNPND